VLVYELAEWVREGLLNDSQLAARLLSIPELAPSNFFQKSLSRKLRKNVGLIRQELEKRKKITRMADHREQACSMLESSRGHC